MITLSGNQTVNKIRRRVTTEGVVVWKEVNVSFDLWVCNFCSYTVILVSFSSEISGMKHSMKNTTLRYREICNSVMKESYGRRNVTSKNKQSWGDADSFKLTLTRLIPALTIVTVKQVFIYKALETFLTYV